MAFSLSEIEKGLQTYQISYRILGPHNTYQKFCSLRRIEKAGIYYIVDKIDSASEIDDSLLFCNQVQDQLLEKGNTLVIVDDPQLVFYRLQNFFFPVQHTTGIHPTALIHAKAIIDERVEIGPYCIIGAATIRGGTRLQASVVVNDNASLGKNVMIEPHSVIGATGIAWAYDLKSGERVIQPQLGGVTVGDNTFIGSDVTVVRGSINENSEIGTNCMIAHGSKIGHGCRIGSHTHFANNVTLAGNVDIGEWSFIGAGAVIRPKVGLAEGTVVAAGAVVIKSIAEPDCLLMGVPAKAKKSSFEELHGIPKTFTKKRRKENEK